MTEQILMIKVKEKIIVLLSLWFDDMDIETIKVFRNSHLEGTDNQSCSF